MFVNMCCTYLTGSTEGFSYRTMIPLTIENTTGCIRIHEWDTFTVPEQNCVAGLYADDMIRLKGQEDKER
jgi:hypothetical protein